MKAGGLFNACNVFVPLLRYSLNHIFYSKEFGLLNLKKLSAIGSDHFPLLIGLNYEPDADNAQGLEKPNAGGKRKVKKKLKMAGRKVL